MNGVIILDKPAGFTSFDAVAVMRGLAREKKIGHTGTLDPMATGVLPLLIGRAAKAADLLPDTDKEYMAGFRLGERFDTGDVTGKIIETSPARASEGDLLRALERFRGDIMQTPPMYSAVSVGGQRLYKLARQGIEIERGPRPVHIGRLELVSFDEKGAARDPCRGLLEGHLYPGAYRGHCKGGGDPRRYDRPAQDKGLRLYRKSCRYVGGPAGPVGGGQTFGSPAPSRDPVWGLSHGAGESRPGGEVL